MRERANYSDVKHIIMVKEEERKIHDREAKERKGFVYV